MVYRKIIAVTVSICCLSGFSVSSLPFNNNLTLIASDVSENVTENGLVYEKLDDHIIITGYTYFDSSELVIPEEIEGLPVTEIGEKAFEKCKGVTSLNIPSSVSVIADTAFNDNSFTEFMVSSENKYFTAKDGVLFSKDMTELVKYPKSKNSDNSEYTIPDEVIEIHPYAFAENTKLKTVIFPENVSKIGEYAFYYCTYIESLELPKGLVSIEDYTFNGCMLMKKITMQEGIEHIGNSAFCECVDLKTAKLPSTVISIGNSAFINCSQMSVNIPQNTETIGDYAYYNNSNVTALIIPDSVKSIGDMSFSYCENLSEIEIGSGLEHIGNNAFYKSNDNVYRIEISEDNPYFSGDWSYIYSKDMTELYFMSANTIGLGCYNEENGKLYMADTVKKLCGTAFGGTNKMKAVVVPDCVEYMDNGVLRGCKNLVRVVITNPECKIYDDPSTISNNEVTFTGTIYAPSGSYAEEYALKYGYNFEAIEQETGDVNGDGNMNGTDLSDLSNYLIGKENMTEREYSRSDLNNDGVVDAFDMVIMRKSMT